jgi:hypothetical protein
LIWQARLDGLITTVETNTDHARKIQRWCCADPKSRIGNGTWKGAIGGDLNWDSGWVPKLVKQGEKFQKQAFEKGASGTPTEGF